MPPSNLTDFSQPQAWKAEIERSRRVAEAHWPEWEQNLEYYTGKSPDAKKANDAGTDWVNVNADFTNVEVKLSQLFFSTPQLQLSARGQFKAPPPPPVPGAPPPQVAPPQAIIAAHRALLNVCLGRDEMDALTVVQKAVKDCLLTAGVGATKICYESAVVAVPPPEQLGNVLNIQQPIPVPVDEQYKWFRIPSKKFRCPADFRDTDFDKAPWLAMDFRLPLSVAKRTLDLPEDFTGTADADDKTLTVDAPDPKETTNIPWVDGTEIWYYASIFDEDVINPKLIRRHVLVDNHDGFVEKSYDGTGDPRDNPYQTLGPDGRLTADSMIGYPIHVLAIRDVPDSSYVPSDSSMTRPLVRELCNFRTQQVQMREANIARIGYDSGKVPPETIRRIEEGTLGALIPFPEGAAVEAGGTANLMWPITQGSHSRDSYLANDYIQRDLDKTLGVDAIGAGVKDQQNATATEISVVDRQRNARLDRERNAVLSFYLKGVSKLSALLCRYMTPQQAAQYIGEQPAAVWGQWNKKQWPGRFVFEAKPDSQIKLDAAAERKFNLDLYQFTAKDPNVNRIPVLKHLMELAGYDPAEVIVEQPPQPKKPDPSVGFTFKGEDFLGPQAQEVREILAQCGIQLSQDAVNQTATQLFRQMALGMRDASGKAVPAHVGPNEHGGVTEKVRPLDQQSADTSGQRRTGPPSKAS